ncbi:MAG: hypothetical protein RL309_758, partial [Verrucomicrobiota bacterium]
SEAEGEAKGCEESGSHDVGLT